MKTTPVTPTDLARSVIAVPPLARDAEMNISATANRQLIRYLEAGGVSTLLYGGNANLYNIGLKEFAQLMEELPTWAAEDTWIIPSIGPSFGSIQDQARIVSDAGYPTVMVLPLSFPATKSGVATGLRRAADLFGGPLIVYLKDESYLSVDLVKELVDDGLVVGIKYAIVREDPSKDPYLEELVVEVDPNLIVSGIGEPPAVIHRLDFGLNGFTSGSVCLAPSLSTSMHSALVAGRRDDADAIREKFFRIEGFRNEVSPIRVLHDAVTLAGVADMGPMLPLLSNLTDADKARVAPVAIQLKELERTLI